MWLFDIYKKADGLYYIIRDDGTIRAHRRRFQHAVEVRDALMFGKKYPTERQQALRDSIEFKIIEKTDSQFPYFIVDNLGTPVRWFRHKYQAKWMLDKVMKSVAARKAAGQSHAQAENDA